MKKNLELCPYCSHVILDDNQKFCDYCGYEVEKYKFPDRKASHKQKTSRSMITNVIKLSFLTWQPMKLTTF